MKAILGKCNLDLGLLIIRVGLGVMFMLHGFPKLQGGPAVWKKLGGAMGNLGISFFPEFWGFMAAFAEFFGGLALALGLFTVPAAFLLTFTMFVAFLLHMNMGDPFVKVASRPFELMLVFIGIMFTGAGKYSLDAKLYKK